MKFTKCAIPILLSVSLCACGANTASSNIVQPITVQHLNEKNVAKADTTTLKPVENPTADIETISQPTNNTPTNNGKGNSVAINSAIKGISIDALGNLVITSANGSNQIVGPVQGVPGPAGPQGPQGPQGPAGPGGNDGHDGHDGINGKDGVDGKDGRGIDHCELDDDKNLIIYYTDNTSENVGSLLVPTPEPEPEPEIPDYEKVGYIVPLANNLKFSGTFSFADEEDYLYFDYSIDNLEVKLVKVAIPNKYEVYTQYSYEVSCDITISNYSGTTAFATVALCYLDANKRQEYVEIFDFNKNGAYHITKIPIGDRAPLTEIKEVSIDFY